MTIYSGISRTQGIAAGPDGVVFQLSEKAARNKSKGAPSPLRFPSSRIA